ncbi:aldose epimerase family protein [Caulobacter segnis]
MLRDDLGMEASQRSTSGATLTAIEAPDREGRFANIVLNRPDIAAYETNRRRYGAVIGRYAGGITDARFTLDGATHALEAGRNNVTLHGGSRGYDKRVWSSEAISDRRSVGVRYHLLSPAGDQGFPGALRVTVSYRLMRKTNALQVEYVARTNAPTVVNFTNHAFFNLAGAGAGTIADHRVWIDADRYAEVDAREAPTGLLPPVTGTVLDFTTPRRVGDVLRVDDPLLASSNGFDHSLVLRQAVPPRTAAGCRWVEDPASGLPHDGADHGALRPVQQRQRFRRWRDRLGGRGLSSLRRPRLRDPAPAGQPQPARLPVDRLTAEPGVPVNNHPAFLALSGVESGARGLGSRHLFLGPLGR